MRDSDVLEPDTAPVDTDPQATALALRRPDIPVTLSELAAMKGEAVEVIEARVQVLETLRKAAIRATSPEDWILFKAPEDQGGQIVGYLQDCGADRVRDLYGIEVYGISKPEKITGNDPNVFHYLVSGSGRCKLTRQVLEDVEGGRASTDDFARGKSGTELELLVRKAARANLDGNITRELAGMKSVPIHDLEAAWAGTPKKIENCRRGRGFGTRDERLGGHSGKGPDVEPPVCTHCGTKGVFRPGKEGRPGFYGCPRYQTHADKKWTVDATKWEAQQKAAAAQAAATASKSAPPNVGDVFGGSREPGSEG